MSDKVRASETIRKREHDPLITARIRVLLGVGFLLFALLIGRLYWLQVMQHDLYMALSENNRVRIRTVRAPRGVILDREGRTIAETAASFDLICTPVDVPDLEGALGLLTRIVPFGADEVEEVRVKIRTAQRANPYASVTIARDLSFDQVSIIEFNREALPGFSILVESKRSYPYGTLFAHVLGYVGEASDQELAEAKGRGLVMGDIVGKYGLERMADAVLRGINGGRHVEVDAGGRDKRLVMEVPPRTGGTVRTTLDLDLQKAAEEALAGRAGTVIALEARTGEVLAFYSGPGFDPNAFARGIRKGEWSALVSDSRKPMQNKGLQGTYPPGSTIKPFLALAALETGARGPGETVFCGGGFRFGNRTFRCWKEKGHGVVDMYRAIVESCDVYFYTLGLKMGPEPITRLEKDAGLGNLTGIDLPGERRGLVPDPEWKQRVYKQRWQDYESILIGIGQGAIHVTPLEMLQAYATLATDGEVVRPRVVRQIVRMDGTVEERLPETVRSLDWKPENVAVIRKALRGVVRDYGTARVARIPGVDLGGKTGTAQVVSIKGKMIKSEDLPYEIRDHAWFAGFAPVLDPEIVVVAMIEHGGSGGSVAAPVFRAVMEAYFRQDETAVGGAPAPGTPSAAAPSPAPGPAGRRSGGVSPEAPVVMGAR
jgi:penicillin-binding protein 2